MVSRAPRFTLSNTVTYYITQLHYLCLIVLVLILPYWGAWKLMRILPFAIFILALFLGRFKIKDLLKNRVILSLFVFIFFTYLSVFWSPSDILFTQETQWGIDRFKWSFLLIPGIYLSTLTQKKIKNLFLIMALAPLGTAAVYYLNALGITHIYSHLFVPGGESHIFVHYLVNNFFLLYSSIYFYLLSFESMAKKEYKKLSLYLLLTLIFFFSMLVDPITTSRLTVLAFFLIAIITPLFYIEKRTALLIFLASVVFITIFINKNENMQRGLSTMNKAMQENKYEGSWGHRLGFAIVGLSIYKEHPIIGRGISDVRQRTILFANENPEYFIGDAARHFHNEHINMLVQVGIVGYLLFAIFIFLLLKTPLNDPLMNKVKYTYTIAFLFMMLGEHYLTVFTTMTFLIFFISFLLVYEQLEKTEKEKIDA